MSGNLAMGGNKVTGLGTPTANADAVTKSYLDAYINTAYLGPLASDPAVRPSGGALQAGDIYFNTTQNILKAYTGSVWVISAAAGNIVRWRKTASAGNTTLSGVDDLGITLSYVVGNEQVYLNGALQTRGVDYTAGTGTSITLTPALLAGDVVELHAVQGYVSATITPGSINDALVAPAAGIQATKLAFTQAGTGATVRTVDSKLKDVVSVKDFGAVGDGVANDTTAFANAIATNKEVFVPKGTYIVNNLSIPDNTRITGEVGATGNESCPTLVIQQNNGAVFVGGSSPSYITIKNIAARPGSGVTGASFFRQTTCVDMAQYCEFHNVQTYKGFGVSYDGFFIFGKWVGCFDGYQGAAENSYHAFIRSAPDNPNAAGVGQTNVCTVRDCKIFSAFGTVPNRAGFTQTDGAAGVIVSFGAQWSFQNTDFESFTNSSAAILRGVKDVVFRECWFEAINNNPVIALSDLTVSSGFIKTYPVLIDGSNFNLTGTPSSANFIYLPSDTTPIPDGPMEWFQDRVVISNCNFGAVISSGTISNRPQQVLLLNCREDPNNSNTFPTFASGARVVATKDINGNLLNDSVIGSYVKTRRWSMGAYGDSEVGGWEAIDVENNKTVARMRAVGYNSGANGEIVWSVIDGSTLTDYLTLTYNGNYLRLLAGGGGLQFNGDTAAANALNDYEEGTWSPDIVVTGGTSITGQETGRYVKVGKLVHASFHFVAAITQAVNTNNVSIANLPFTALSATYDAVGGGNMESVNSTALVLTVTQNTNTAGIFNAAGGAMTPTTLGILSSSIKTFRGTIVYRTA
jgi:hypothetical protein